MSAAAADDRARWARGAVLTGVALAIGLLYLWIARTSANGRFYWGHTLAGYYNYLSRGFLQGHLHLALDPDPQLLALPDPWDPNIDGPFKMWDLVLFHQRYYLYHGAGPAVMLFVPWRLIVGHDLHESFAAFLFCFGGFLCYCGALLRILRLAEAPPPPPLLALMLLALGLCQCVPYLLNRIFVYEVAISGGYFSIAAAVYFLARSIQSRHSNFWLATSGLMFGIAISCRPHLGAAGVIALAGIALSRARWREITAFVVPFCLASLAVASYNYQRFGDLFEFGMKYELAGEAYRNPKPAAQNIPPGLYYMLFCQPDFSPVFPWVRQAFRPPFGSNNYPFPKRYFIEPTIGALYLAPLLAGLLLVPSAGRRAKRARSLLWILPATAVPVLLFIAAIGLTSQRFEADFLPPVVLASVAAAGIRIARSTGWGRVVLCTAFTVCAAFGAVVSLALGVTGPYDDLLTNRPHTYMRIARWFSPIERFRPLMNPRVAVDFTAAFTPREEGFREPLLTMGQQAHRYFLYAHHTGGRVRITSRGDGPEMAHEIDMVAGRPVPIRVTHKSGRMTVQVSGREVLVHEIKTLVTAPAQVTVGENRIDHGVTAERFTGQIRQVTTAVSASLGL